MLQAGPPDRIVGYTTQGRGVTIHRADCSVTRHLEPAQQARLLKAEWGAAAGEVFAVDVGIVAQDRQGLLKDVSEILAQERINAIRVNTQTQDEIARMDFTLEVRDIDQLTRFLSRVTHVRGVTQARRK